jgi:hypothetical protein
MSSNASAAGPAFSRIWIALSDPTASQIDVA